MPHELGELQMLTADLEEALTLRRSGDLAAGRNLNEFLLELNHRHHRQEKANKSFNTTREQQDALTHFKGLTASFSDGNIFVGYTLADLFFDTFTCSACTMERNALNMCFHMCIWESFTSLVASRLIKISASTENCFSSIHEEYSIQRA